MPRPPSRRYPFRALLGYAGNGSVRSFADVCGLHLKTVQRWLIDGIPEHSGDRVCVQLGLHPAEVWSDWVIEEVA